MGWQYDVLLLPRIELEAQAGGMPGRVALDDLHKYKFWSKGLPVKDVSSKFDCWGAEIKSWHHALRCWGSEESDRIDVRQENGRIHYMEFRIDLRSINVSFIQLLVDVARDVDCVILSAHSLEIIAPVREQVLIHLSRSNGAGEVWDFMRDPYNRSPKKRAERVFLSHSSLDKTFVSRLAIDLRNHNVPVWYDKWELKVGDSLSGKISDGIDGSGYLAVVLSINSVKSDWVKRELSAALAIELQKTNVFVLPIVIDDCTIPTFMLDKLFADFRNSYIEGLHSLLARL